MSSIQPHALRADIVLKGGLVIDGTGQPAFAADVAVRGGSIVAVGELRHVPAGRVIDVTGLVVAPGFIDTLGQSETALLVDNRSLSKLSQGITSEITGEGGSIAPQDALTLAALQPALEPYHLKVDWTDLRGYFQRLEKTGILVENNQVARHDITLPLGVISQSVTVRAAA